MERERECVCVCVHVCVCMCVCVRQRERGGIIYEGGGRGWDRQPVVKIQVYIYAIILSLSVYDLLEWMCLHNSKRF